MVQGLSERFSRTGKSIGEEKMRAEADKILLEKVMLYSGKKEKGMIFKQAAVTKLTFAQLRDSLLGLGRILEEDFENKIYVTSIAAGVADRNAAVVAVRLSGDSLDLAGYAREGLIKQHTAEKAIEKICTAIHARGFLSDVSKAQGE